MQIELNNVGKRFNREWIFRNLTYTFDSEKKYAITGNNGSGKSTLLQIIAGAVMHSEGTIEYKSEKPSQITNDIVHQHLSIAAPYLELIEEMTANEFLHFHHEFKKLTHSFKEILSITGLENAADKQIRYYSSGMKQRLKLAQAFFSETSVLLLDEPTSNLDESGIQLYKMLIRNYTKGRLIIVSSNDSDEYDFCDEVLPISNYK
jgi:ABC-type multidrug transport system ATPase subunit